MKKKVIIGVIVVLAVVAVIVALGQVNGKGVQTYAIKKSNIEDYIEVRGKVELSTSRKVFSRLGGVVLDVVADEGDVIDTNSELAKIDVQDLSVSISKAEAAYNSAKASLADLQKSIKPEQIKQAEYQVEQGKVAIESYERDYELRKEKLDKARTLYSNNAISKQEVDEAEAFVNTAKDVLEDAKLKSKIASTNLDVLKKGVSKEAITVAEVAVEQARLNLQELKDRKGKASVYSAIKGTVLSKFVQEGENVQEGTPLFEIGDIDSSYISIDVLVDDARKMALGNKVVISGEVLKDNPIDGEIYYIAPKAVTKVSSLGVEQQRIEMKVKYDSGKIKKTISLRPGYSVDVKVITESKESAFVVPAKAIISMNGSKSVFIVKDGKLELRNVKVGIENSNTVEIIEGVSEGDIVVVDPSNDLKPGIKVKSDNMQK